MYPQIKYFDDWEAADSIVGRKEQNTFIFCSLNAFIVAVRIIWLTSFFTQQSSSDLITFFSQLRFRWLFFYIKAPVLNAL